MTGLRMNLGALGSALLFFGMLYGAADAAPVTVERQGFCVTKSATSCSEVALSNTNVDLNRLPKLDNGTRVIYFFSVQKADINSTFVHVLESEDTDSHVDYNISSAAGDHSSKLMPALKAVAKKLITDGGGVVTAFHVARAGEPAMVFSSIPVTGPGVFHGSVVDLKGNLIPSSERISISAVQKPK
jgi:hypothetical protein